jgi:hypothetical protein
MIKIDNKMICLLLLFFLILVSSMFYNSSNIEGLEYDPDDVKTTNTEIPDLSPVQPITHDFKDLYQLKTETFPHVKTDAYVEDSEDEEKGCKKNDDLSDGKCPPCPPCARCPEPSFECKKVPNYSSGNDQYLPRPVLNDFSEFGF